MIVKEKKGGQICSNCKKTMTLHESGLAYECKCGMIKEVEKEVLNYNKKYKIIYADPAWTYSGQLFNRGGVKNKYKTLHQRKIEELNVPAISHTDSVCFMWATFPKIEEALYIMRAWGFTYKTVAFSWLKTYKKSGKLFFGMGKWTRANGEICLLGTKGNIKRINASVPQALLHPILEHSVKPQEVRERIVKLMGDIPRIELFARTRTDGWDAWGNEIDNDIEIPFMNMEREELTEDSTEPNPNNFEKVEERGLFSFTDEPDEVD